MKSLLFKLLVVIVSVVVLSACGDDSATNNKSTSSQNETSSNENTEQQEEASITVVLSKNKEAEILEEREVEIEEGDILLDVMKENFDVEEEGGFINTLEGLSLDEETKCHGCFLSMASSPW
ncbi:hypothetical protein [Ornithinibacillus scapharcae]|uniref:hypothetical protein n=1 Tax=Ornithinibacillus scapharcae TaxID=1147159 RepID=UPI000225BBAC|nr:hypothetical protein [Ornithinibacillus scapharcae]